MSEAAPLTAPSRHRSFALLWGGFIVSHVGDFVQILAQSWLVVDLTRSAAMVAGVAFAQAVPRFLVTLAAGVVVDRVDRRRLLLATQSLAAVQSALFLALVVTGRITYAWIVGLSFALGFLDALNLTARQAVMPSLVPRALLPRAVALQALGVNITQIAGPSLGGVLLGALGVRGCLAFNVASFAVLVVTLWAADIPSPATPEGPRPGWRDDLREGVAYLRARRVLWIPLLLAYGLGLFGMPLVRLLPLYARAVLAVREEGFGMLAAASGLGAIVASLAVTARARPKELPRNIFRAGVGFALATLAFAWSDRVAWSFAALVLFGGTQMAFRSAVMTVFQTEVPDRLRGRVISVLGIDFALWSVGGVALGAVGDAVARAHGGSGDAATAYGLHVALSLAGALCLATVILARRALAATVDEIGAGG